MGIQYKDLKKGDNLKTIQLGAPVTGVLLESPKQGRGLKSILLIHTHGSEIEMFDEAGSVYASDVSKVKRDGDWLDVIEPPKDGKELTNILFGE